MKFTYFATTALSLLSHSMTEASFLRDVVGNKEVNSRQAATEAALLAKAVPIDEYRAQLRAKGYYIPSSRRLDDAGDDAAQDDDGDDAANQEEEEEQQDENENENGGQGNNYYADADYSFEGYSLKYAKCQPVQRFSEDAINAGEYSPMITDDVVILRLCPYRFCSASRTFGCNYNYAEYAIGLSEYVAIMLQYKMDKTGQLCDWCGECANARRLDDAGDDAAQGDDQAADDAVEGDDAAAANGDDDNNWWNYVNGDDGNVYDEDDACYSYDTYCFDEDGDSVCADEDGGDDAYLDTEEYLDYLDCVNIKDDENYNYYVQPRCDGEKQTIKMGIFYDQFCSQYAGNQVSLQDFGLGFRDSYFEEMYSTDTCMDCSVSETAPNFDANSYLCSSIHYAGAKCTTNLHYDGFDNDKSSSGEEKSECSYIESIRNGSYDEKGQLYSSSSFFGSDRSITSGQKYGLGISLGLCALLAVYSCYLHHSITNLLIKSLSHTDLLPPSRSRRSSRDNNNSRGRRSSGRRGSGRRKRLTDDEEDDSDWDTKGGVAA